VGLTSHAVYYTSVDRNDIQEIPDPERHAVRLAVPEDGVALALDDTAGVNHYWRRGGNAAQPRECHCRVDHPVVQVRCR